MSAKIGLVISRWNQMIVDRLVVSADQVLAEAGFVGDSVVRIEVPGAFEIPQGCKALIDRANVDAVVTLGCVIRGQTPHFDYVAGECARGINDLALRTGVPISFGVLTCDNSEQALDRAGGEFGNKGEEAAAAALALLASIQGLVK